MVEYAPTNERLALLEEWKVSVTCLLLLLPAFPLLIGSHIVASRYLSVPWLPTEAEGALIGIPAALVVYLSVPKILNVPYNAVFVIRPDRSVFLWLGYGVLLVLTLVGAAAAVLPGTFVLDADRIQSLPYVLTGAVLLALLAAVTEELLFRANLMALIGHRWNWPAAILVTAMAFGMLHNAKGGGSTATAVYVWAAGAAGLLYALVVFYTGSVWNAVSLHAVWNTAFHPDIISFTSNDGGASRSLVTYVYTAPNPLFGDTSMNIFASPFVVVFLAVASFVVVLYYERVNRVRKSFKIKMLKR